MAASPRPTLEMHDHGTHDLTLIAGLAGGDLAGADRARAQATLSTCPECAAIHADLIAIAAATRTLPKRATAPHDYRISAEQASRLHRRGWLRTLLAPFAGAQSAARPLATAFTSLGLVGLLVVTVLPGMLGGAASMPAPERQSTGGAGALAAPTAAPAQPLDNAKASTVPVAAGPGAQVDSTASEPPEVLFGVRASAFGSEVPRALGDEPGSADGLVSSPSPNPLLVGSLALLAIGLGLFGLRFAARRLR
jgi:anti-sigma factor RsiW